MTDPYLRERMHDFDDLANRLLRAADGTRARGRWPRPAASDAIIVARSMGAAELLDYARERLRGLVLEEGAATSHVAIVARAMGIPVAGQVEGRRVAWRKTAMRSSSTATTARCICGRSPMSRRPMPKRCASAPAGRSSTGELRKQAVGDQGRRPGRRC